MNKPVIRYWWKYSKSLIRKKYMHPLLYELCSLWNTQETSDNKVGSNGKTPSAEPDSGLGSHLSWPIWGDALNVPKRDFWVSNTNSLISFILWSQFLFAVADSLVFLRYSWLCILCHMKVYYRSFCGCQMLQIEISMDPFCDLLTLKKKHWNNFQFADFHFALAVCCSIQFY